MKKCPKCGFEQPPDTYCASCGVNMETYRPDPKPLWKTLIGHWMFQLAALISVILVLVIYDRSKGPTETPEVSAQWNQTEVNAPPSSTPTRVEPLRASSPAEAATNALSENPESSNTAAAAPPAARLAGVKPVPLGARNSIQVTYFRATRNAINELQREAQQAMFSGEASGGVIPRRKIQQLRDQKELRSLSSSSHKDYDLRHPIMIFKGQRSPSTGKNIGLFFQITPLKEETLNQQLEVKSWGNLKINGNEENLFISEMVINLQSGVFITGFLPRDRSFNDEEKIAFESDRTLQIYNDGEFWEGSQDLIMYIELVQPN